jgi:hypothetical protein
MIPASGLAVFRLRKNSISSETKGTDYSVPAYKLVIHRENWPWTERSVPFVSLDIEFFRNLSLAGQHYFLRRKMAGTTASPTLI